MITPKNVTQHELIGLEATVKDGNPPSVGIEGKVVDETMNTLKIDTTKGEKTIMKRNSTFIFTLPSKKRVMVGGGAILARPEDRIRKKVKKW